MEKTKTITYVTCDCCGKESLSPNANIEETEYPSIHLCGKCRESGWEPCPIDLLKEEYLFRTGVSLETEDAKYGFTQSDDLTVIRFV